MGHSPRFVRGRRITGDLDLEIARWVTRGSVNLDLVSRAAQHGLRAVGISGVDGALLRLRRRPPWTVDGAEVDFGWVGDVLGACPDILDALHSAGFIPVVASLGADDSGQVLNVNADTVAGAIAAATGARELLMVTPSGGLRRRVDEPDSLLSVCTARESSAGLAEGWIAGRNAGKADSRHGGSGGGHRNRPHSGPGGPRRAALGNPYHAMTHRSCPR